MSKAPKIQFILEKTGNGKNAHNYALFACRGEGRGCSRNKYRSRLKHCDDCVATNNGNETLAELNTRLQRGDA